MHKNYKEFVVNMSSIVHWKLSAALYQSGLQIPLPSNMHKNFIIVIISLMHNLYKLTGICSAHELYFIGNSLLHFINKFLREAETSPRVLKYQIRGI